MIENISQVVDEVIGVLVHLEKHRSRGYCV